MIHERKVEKERDNSFTSQHCRYLRSVGTFIASLVILFVSKFVHLETKSQSSFCCLRFILSCFICLPRTHNFEEPIPNPFLSTAMGKRGKILLDGTPNSVESSIVFVCIQQLSAHHAFCPQDQSAFSVFHLGKREKRNSKKKNRYFYKHDSTIIGNFETLIISQAKLSLQQLFPNKSIQKGKNMLVIWMRRFIFFTLKSLLVFSP